MNTVRLPMYNEDGIEIPAYLEVDVEYFVSSTRGLRSHQARVVQTEPMPMANWEREIYEGVVKEAEQKELDRTATEEIEIIDRIIYGLPHRIAQSTSVVIHNVHVDDELVVVEIPTKIEWRSIPGFEDYEMNNNAIIRDPSVGGDHVPFINGGHRASPSVMLYSGKQPKHLDVGILFKKTFPELAP